jgi:hypothetical protein
MGSAWPDLETIKRPNAPTLSVLSTGAYAEAVVRAAHTADAGGDQEANSPQQPAPFPLRVRVQLFPIRRKIRRNRNGCARLSMWT